MMPYYSQTVLKPVHESFKQENFVLTPSYLAVGSEMYERGVFPAGGLLLALGVWILNLRFGFETWGLNLKLSFWSLHFNLVLEFGP